MERLCHSVERLCHTVGLYHSVESLCYSVMSLAVEGLCHSVMSLGVTLFVGFMLNSMFRAGNLMFINPLASDF